jgi:DNA mismatch endonuclease (patch repair protein)
MHAGCKYAKLPSTRPEFWLPKLEGNVARDHRAIESLLADGWRALTVWECATRGPESLIALSKALPIWIEGFEKSGEISAAPPP